MENFALFIGIDLGKREFYTAFRYQSQLVNEEKYENTASGIAHFIQDIQAFGLELNQVLIALEHCGVYVEKLVMALYAEGLFTWLWNPLIAKHAPLDLNRHKDDPRDAKTMAILAQNYQAKARRYTPPSAREREIKDLSLLRRQLIKQRTQLINQKKSNLDKAAPLSLAEEVFQQLIDTFNAKIKQLEKQLQKTLLQSERFKRVYTILTSIPGIGPVTATQLIEISRGFTTFNSEIALAKYAGTLPLKHLSGSSIKRKPRSSKRANKQLKVNLTMGATSQIRKGMFFENFYRYKTEVQKMEHLKVINIIRNTLLKLAVKLVKLDQEFDPDTFRKNKKSWQVFLTLS